MINSDGTGLRRLVDDDDATLDEEVTGVWSPDGRFIALPRWRNPDGQVDPRPMTVVEVATGRYREVGRANLDGYVWFGWSPDSTTLVTVPGNGPRLGLVLGYEAATGVQRPLGGWVTVTPPSWQRLAPVSG